MELSERLDAAQPHDVRTRAARDLADSILPTVQQFLAATCDKDDPKEDMLSIVWINVFTAIEKQQYHHAKGANPGGWVIGIVKHVVQQTHYQKAQQRTHEVELMDDFDLTDEYFTHDSTPQIDPAWFNRLDVSVLSDEEQITFSLMRDGATIGQIADSFQVSYKTAWRRFHKVFDYCQQHADHRSIA